MRMVENWDKPSVEPREIERDMHLVERMVELMVAHWVASTALQKAFVRVGQLGGLTVVLKD